jgi:polynucleotide 5'-hydroxyl-kinase GRC3/NOL9
VALSYALGMLFAADRRLCYTVAVVDIIASPQWDRLNIEELLGTVMVVGASDTGKSTLARFLFQRLVRNDIQAAFLDTDVGQSTVGLPTTLNLALAGGPADDRFPPQGRRASFFVGSTTPRGHMLPVVVGAYRLQQQALALGAQAVVVDTSGLVDSEQGGKALKQWKIELLAPSLVIGLQRGRELEPILWPLRRDRRVRCIELSASLHVVERTREERVARRRQKLASYLEGARPIVVDLRRMAVYDVDELARGALVALQDAEGFVLGLGVVEQVMRLEGTVDIRTPLLGFEAAASLRFGAARWDLAGRREL